MRAPSRGEYQRKRIPLGSARAWFLLPPWGLSSREPQIPKSLRLFVCLWQKRRRFTEWHLHRLQTQMPFGVLSEPSKEGPKSLSFNPPVELISGTRNFYHFFHFLKKISACSGELQSIIETHLLFANVTDREVRKSPSKGATCPAGPN